MSPSRCQWIPQESWFSTAFQEWKPFVLFLHLLPQAWRLPWLSCLQSTLTFNLSKTDQERSCQALHLPSLLFHSSAHSLTHPLTNPLTYQGLPPAHLPVLHSQGCSLLSSYTVCHGQRLAGCLGRELLWKYDNGVGLILHSGITDEGNCPLQALLG